MLDKRLADSLQSFFEHNFFKMYAYYNVNLSIFHDFVLRTDHRLCEPEPVAR
jgi:hypothetical protein